MKWFLIFCSQVHFGSSCLPPTPQPNQQVCYFVGEKMKQTADEVTGLKTSSYHCISVPATR
jgi:hypothetical protein